MDQAPAPASFPNPAAATAPHKPSEQEQQQIQRHREVADLTLMPGWLHFVEGYKKQIQALRSLAGHDISKLDDAQLGQLTRASTMAADRMEAELVKTQSIAKSIHGRVKPVDA